MKKSRLYQQPVLYGVCFGVIHLVIFLLDINYTLRGFLVILAAICILLLLNRKRAGSFWNLTKRMIFYLVTILIISFVNTYAIFKQIDYSITHALLTLLIVLIVGLIINLIIYKAQK